MATTKTEAQTNERAKPAADQGAVKNDAPQENAGAAQAGSQAPTAEQAQEALAPQKVRGLRIVPLTGLPSYRSAGRAWANGATDVPLDELEPWQVRRLKADRLLCVTEIELDAPQADAAAASV